MLVLATASFLDNRPLILCYLLLSVENYSATDSPSYLAASSISLKERCFECWLSVSFSVLVKGTSAVIPIHRLIRNKISFSIDVNIATYDAQMMKLHDNFLALLTLYTLYKVVQIYRCVM